MPQTNLSARQFYFNRDFVISPPLKREENHACSLNERFFQSLLNSVKHTNWANKKHNNLAVLACRGSLTATCGTRLSEQYETFVRELTAISWKFQIAVVH